MPLLPHPVSHRSIKKKKKMKLMIASDLHGSFAYADQLISRFREEKADKLLLLGDLLYHGPRNDLPLGYAPKKVIELLNGIKEYILCVRGNCDAEVDQMVLDFPIMAESLTIDVDEQRLVLVHGHHLSDNPPSVKTGDVVLFGHTHIPAKEERDGVFYLNPGSVSIPKEQSPHGYMTYEKGVFFWKTLEGEPYQTLFLKEEEQ